MASKPAPAAKKEPEAAPAIATKKAGDPKAPPPADKQGGGFFDFFKPAEGEDFFDDEPTTIPKTPIRAATPAPVPVVAPQKLKPVKVVAADVKAPSVPKPAPARKEKGSSGMFDFLVSAPKSSLPTRRENARARAPARAPAPAPTPAPAPASNTRKSGGLLDFLAPSPISVPKKENKTVKLPPRRSAILPPGRLQ